MFSRCCAVSKTRVLRLSGLSLGYVLRMLLYFGRFTITLKADLHGATFAYSCCTQLAYPIYTTRIVSRKSSLKLLHATQKKLLNFETCFKVVRNFDVFATKLPEWGGLWHMIFAETKKDAKKAYLIQMKWGNL